MPMKEMNMPIFKSGEGRQAILDFYRSQMKNIPFAYREKRVASAFGATYVLEAGKDGDPAVLLLHGSCSCSAMWYGDIGKLSAGYHVFAVDIIGEPGFSEARRLDFAAGAYAEWIREVMDGLHLETAAIAGYSLGGWMALKFAAAYPGRVEKLILISTSGITGVKTSYVLSLILNMARGEKGKKAISRLIYGDAVIPAEVLVFTRLVGEHFNPITSPLPVFSDGQLKGLPMPVLYIGGAKDATVDARKTARRLTRLVPRATVSLDAGCGHVVLEYLPRVLSFLSGPA